MRAASDIPRVLQVYRRYLAARTALLQELRLDRQSNRDPLAEFSEWLVAALVHGERAKSPVQAAWDVKAPDGENIQVKYLANPSGPWINEHEIRVSAAMDAYALVAFAALAPRAAIIFPARRLSEIGHALGKRHGNLDTTLQLTQANYQRIIDEPARFAALDVHCYLAPSWKRL